MFRSLRDTKSGAESSPTLYVKTKKHCVSIFPVPELTKTLLTSLVGIRESNFLSDVPLLHSGVQWAKADTERMTVSDRQHLHLVLVA